MKTEARSPPKPVQSALNSAIDEKTKSVKTDKHDKVKTGKAVKLEKKGDKKMDGLKKEKKEKKADGVKTVKKHVDSDNDDDDDAPLVRFNLTIFFFFFQITLVFFLFLFFYSQIKISCFGLDCCLSLSETVITTFLTLSYKKQNQTKTI